MHIRKSVKVHTFVVKLLRLWPQGRLPASLNLYLQENSTLNRFLLWMKASSITEYNKMHMIQG